MESKNHEESIFLAKIIYIKDKLQSSQNLNFIEYAIGVDPAFGGKSEIGIILGGKTKDEKIIILGDFSGYYKPEIWVYYIQKLAVEFGGTIAIEINHGGELLTSLFSGFDLYSQRAVNSKYERALSCYLLYKQKKVTHLECFSELEDQMVYFEKSKKDRVDALVWLINYFNRYENQWNHSRNFIDTVKTSNIY